MRGWLMNGGRLAHGEEHQLQRVLGATPSSSSIQAPAPAKRRVERGEGTLVLHSRQDCAHPLAGRLQGARQAHDPHPARQALHMAELGHDVAVDEDQPARLVAAQEIGRHRVQADAARGASASGTFADLTTLVYFQSSARLVGKPCSTKRA